MAERRARLDHVWSRAQVSTHAPGARWAAPDTHGPPTPPTPLPVLPGCTGGWLTRAPHRSTPPPLDSFGCCTANFNQGWPKLAAAALLTKPSDGGIVVALLLPVAAKLPGGSTVTVNTSYPLDDTVTVTLAVPPAGTATTLYVRVPGWAYDAEYSVDGGAASPAANGTLIEARCAPGARLTLTLALHPTIRVETGWGGKAGRRTNPEAGATSGGYSRWVGSMPAGGDVHVANMTIAAAEAWCNASATCVGFTTRATAEEMAELPAGVGGSAPVEDDRSGSPQHGHGGHHAHVHHAHHEHSHGHDADDVARRRVQPPPPAPPLPPGPVPNPPPTGVGEIYFKAAFNPNTDRHWRSYAKISDVKDTNAASVLRGPLLYALRLKQVRVCVRGGVQMRMPLPLLPPSPVPPLPRHPAPSRATRPPLPSPSRAPLSFPSPPPSSTC